MSLQKIPTRQLGRNGPIIGAIALGTMSEPHSFFYLSSRSQSIGFGKFYGSHDDEEAYETLSRAVDRGMTYWETADVFGDCTCSYLSRPWLPYFTTYLTRQIPAEKLIGQWFSRTGRRSEVFLGTSFGSFDPEKPYHGPDPDSSPANIHKSIARSMRFLNTNYIDLYTQGRVDPKVPIEVVMKTLGEYIDKGMIRWIGLSECSAEVLRRAKAVPSVGEKVIAVQREYSPFDLGIERDGFMQCAKEVGITVVPYSPLGRGLATGRLVLPCLVSTGGTLTHLYPP